MAAPDLRSGDGQEHIEAEAGQQVTDWVARLEKLEEAPAAESDSGLLVQPACVGSRRMCQTFAPPIRCSGKYRPASVRFTAYSRQTEAGVARALISRLEAAESLPSSWLFEVGVDQYQGQPLRARALSLQLTTAQGSQAWLGPRLVPPQSHILKYRERPFLMKYSLP